jgi:ribonuclease P protein component
VGRLLQREDFLRVAAQRRSCATPGLVVQCAPQPAENRDEESVRFGLTLSRKVGGAVSRNRARRRLRALAIEVLDRHGARARDYVLIGRAETVRRPFAGLRQDLEKALRRLGAWRDGNGALEGRNG